MKPKPLSIFYPSKHDGMAPVTYQHRLPIPGRNDTCRCGSGKKFKKCCLDKATQPVRDALASANKNAHLVAKLKEAGE